MGTARVSRMAPAFDSVAKLESWFREQLADMHDDGGIGPYCGNWNACSEGLHVIERNFSSRDDALTYAEKHIEKNGAVLALRIGDFSKVWPSTKAQKELQAKLDKLETEINEFDYRILERSQKQKSKTKKCAHCESSINVHKLALPALRELTQQRCSSDEPGIVYRFGRYLISSWYGMTDCPVCFKNLLKTDTDKKNFESLKARLQEGREKSRKSLQAFDLEMKAKPSPYYFLVADCGE